MKNIISILISCFMICSVYAQTNNKQGGVFIEQWDLNEFPAMKIYFSVLDTMNNSITGLNESNIKVAEDGKIIDSTSVKAAFLNDEYISVVLAIDRSGSMKGDALQKAKEAAIDFIKRLTENDYAAFITFDQNVEIKSPFTKDKSAMEQKINDVQIGGNTALYDAVYESAQMFLQHNSKRKAIILLTDGKNTESKKIRDDGIKNAKNLNVPVFMVGLGNEINKNELEIIANECGGSFYYAPAPGDLIKIYQQIASRLKNQYLLKYSTKNKWDGRLHPLKISVATGKDTLKTEKGYFAGVVHDMIPSSSGSRQFNSIFIIIGGAFGLLFGLITAIVVKSKRESTITIIISIVIIMTCLFALGGAMVGYLIF